MVEQDIRALIRRQGRITFAEFMQRCLYSPRGGFFASRNKRISAHFGTAPSSHPAFGALIARQLAQMWRLLGEPRFFYCIEVGCADGTLAKAIVHAAQHTAPHFAQALYYVAADYAPRWLHDATGTNEFDTAARAPIQRVKAEGVRAFRNVVGCVLCNELIDNFSVHQFVIEGGQAKEVFVTVAQDRFTEVLDAPSTPLIQARLDELGLTLPDGYRGAVNLAMADWLAQLSVSIERGFVLTIDYGELAADLYASANSGGTLVCYREHEAGKDPYQRLGQQDITALVDFTALMRLGEQHGLTTVGYTRQSEFLANLGFSSFVDALEQQDLSAARKTLARMALLSLVDPEQYGDFKVLAQAKGIALDETLLGFTPTPPSSDVC
ncbi:MAG: SAM-dependent methyltransferase [Betaproteobacteria bacterium]|nr:SAM-dependent methyltransferase [Betaproteobacteria bacterium]